jgi:hypothetical protein
MVIDRGAFEKFASRGNIFLASLPTQKKLIEKTIYKNLLDIIKNKFLS